MKKSFPPLQLTFWNSVDDVAFPDPVAFIVGIVCRNVVPSSFLWFQTICLGVGSLVLWQVVVGFFGHSRWRVWS